MQLEFAFLADAAQVTPDGKFTVLGGGLNVIYAPQFPALHPSLSIVTKLNIDNKDELEVEHTLRAELFNPLNATAMPPLSGKFIAQPIKDHPDWPVSAQFTMTINGLLFELPGKYIFRLSVDNKLLGTFPLYTAMQKPASSLSNQIRATEEEA